MLPPTIQRGQVGNVGPTTSLGSGVRQIHRSWIMKRMRIAVAVIGILLPYLVRIPRGAAWLEQYTDTGLRGFLFIGAFNAMAWGSIIALSFLFRRPALLLFPCVTGFTFLGWAHYTLDLAADAQAAIALSIIPIYALLPIAVDGAAGYALNRRSNRHPSGSVLVRPR